MGFERHDFVEGCLTFFTAATRFNSNRASDSGHHITEATQGLLHGHDKVFAFELLSEAAVTSVTGRARAKHRTINCIVLWPPINPFRASVHDSV